MTVAISISGIMHEAILICPDAMGDSPSSGHSVSLEGLARRLLHGSFLSVRRRVEGISPISGCPCSHAAVSWGRSTGRFQAYRLTGEGATPLPPCVGQGRNKALSASRVI